MAQTTYTSIALVTLATRDVAYTKLAALMEHLDHGFGGLINLVSVTVNADHTITVVLSAPLPADQLTHLGLQ